MPPPPDEKLAPKLTPTLSPAVRCVDAAGFEEGMAPPLTPPSFPKLKLLEGSKTVVRAPRDALRTHPPAAVLAMAASVPPSAG